MLSSVWLVYIGIVKTTKITKILFLRTNICTSNADIRKSEICTFLIRVHFLLGYFLNLWKTQKEGLDGSQKMRQLEDQFHNLMRH